MDKEKLQRGLGLFLDAMRPYLLLVDAAIARPSEKSLSLCRHKRKPEQLLLHRCTSS